MKIISNNELTDTLQSGEPNFPEEPAPVPQPVHPDTPPQTQPRPIEEPPLPSDAPRVDPPIEAPPPNPTNILVSSQ